MVQQRRAIHLNPTTGGFGLNELLGRNVQRRHTERDGLRLQHHEDRTCAATNLPGAITHDAAMLDRELRSAGATQLHGNSPKRDERANAANQRLTETTELHERRSHK